MAAGVPSVDATRARVNMTDLEVTDLCKSFGPLVVLRDLSLAIAPGSFTSILGPSGSGKTTLLRIVAGFERADRGIVRIGSEVADDGTHYLSPDRRHIGYVPQEGNLFPHLSVEQNVGFGLPRRERHGKKVAELLDMVGLGGLQRRYPHELSGGQQQRVALARALAIEPALVLLDEPFSSLDESLRANVRQDVRRVLRGAGATVVLVTHDQDEALSLSDRVAIMTEGAIGQYDAPEDIYRSPATPEIARRLGDSNFIRGIDRGDRAETALGVLQLERPVDHGGTSQPGSSLVVLLRPEQIALDAGPDGEQADDGASAVVVETEFYGHDAVVRLRPNWERSTLLTARTGDASRAPSVGTRVSLGVRGPVVAWRDRTLAHQSVTNTTTLPPSA
jgi:iron(III) transport system ATP-binding protein